MIKPDFFARALLLGGIGLVLLTANYYYIRSLSRQFFARPTFDTIAPFRITGKEDPEDKLGLSLAQLLQARISKLISDVQTALNSLSASESFLPVLGNNRDPLLKIPKELQQSIDDTNLQIKVANVELSGVVGYVSRTLAGYNALQATVHYRKSGGALVACPTEDGASVWLQVDGDDEEVVDAVAYSVLQQAMSKETRQLAGLEWTEFREIISAADSVRVYLERSQLGRSSPSDLKPTLSRLKPVAIKMRRWPELLRFVREIAVHADDVTTQREMLEMELSLARTEEEQKAIQKLIDALEPAHYEEETLRRLGFADRPVPTGRKTCIALYGISPYEVPESDPRVRVLGPTDVEDEKARYAARVAWMDIGLRAIHSIDPDAVILLTHLADEHGRLTTRGQTLGMARLLAEKPDVIVVKNVVGGGTDELVRVCREAARYGGVCIVGDEHFTDSWTDLKTVAEGLLLVRGVDSIGNSRKPPRDSLTYYGVPDSWPRYDRETDRTIHHQSMAQYIAAALVTRLTALRTNENALAVVRALTDKAETSSVANKALAHPKLLVAPPTVEPTAPVPQGHTK